MVFYPVRFWKFAVNVTDNMIQLIHKMISYNPSYITMLYGPYQYGSYNAILRIS